MKRLLAIIFGPALIIFSFIGVETALATPTALFGIGTATIDGVLSPSEWDSAGYYDLSVNTPYGGTTLGRLFAMNDGENAYFGLRFERSVADAGNSLAIEFDNDGSRTLTNGDDGILVNPTVGFSDLFRSSGFGCPFSKLCSFLDVNIGGTNDGAGAFANDATHTVYELSHPLNSGDSFDFSLASGDTIGMSLFVRTMAVGGTWPNNTGDTDIPFGVLEFAINSVPDPPTCEDVLAVVTAQRDQCSSDLNATTTLLNTAQSELAACLALPKWNDEDGDGEEDRTDACTGTPLGIAVDQAGCSLSQVCTKGNATTREGRTLCKAIDWKNDEPLVSPLDCTVVKQSGVSRCVAAP